MATLSDLPAELVDAICEHVTEKEHLHNVCRVSRVFRVAAARFLFDRVHLSHNPTDIDCFERLTSHPKLRGHAKELVFDISTFNPDLLDSNCFWGLITQHPPNCLRDDPRHKGHILDSERSRKWYEKATEECGGDVDAITNRRMEAATEFLSWFHPLAQKHIDNWRTNRATHALRKALMSGWRVERIVMTSMVLELDNGNAPDGPVRPYQLPTRSWNTREWEKMIPDVPGLIPLAEILPRAGWMNLDQELHEILDLGNSGNTLDGWMATTSMDWQEWLARRAAGGIVSCFHSKPIRSPFRELSSILRILEETQRLKEVSEFSVIPGSRLHPDCCDCGEGMSSAIFLTNGPDMMRLKGLSANLKVLRLVTEAVSNAERLAFRYQGLNDFLRCGSESLQEVYLDFVNHWTFSSGCYLLRDLTFKRLRKIHLCDVSFTDLELFSFLHRNKHCLRKLLLCGCFLFSQNRHVPSWWAVLEELRSMGCFREMELYINEVGQEYPGRADGTLVMEGEPDFEDGIATWKTWTAGGERFPLKLKLNDPNGLQRVPALTRRIPVEYRELLRSAL